MSYFLPDGAYTVLKWVGLIALPAIAVFMGTVGPVWGLSDSVIDAIVTTLNAAGVLIGALIGVSSATAKDDTDTTEDLDATAILGDYTDFEGESLESVLASDYEDEAEVIAEQEAMGKGEEE